MKIASNFTRILTNENVSPDSKLQLPYAGAVHHNAKKLSQT